jgi:hypothetical protein
MPHQQCTVCAHPDLASIDQALRSGTPSLRDLAKQTGLNASALFRHKQHAKVGKELTTKHIPEEIRKLKIMLNSAKRRKDTPGALSISREIRAWMLLEARTRPIVAQDHAIGDEMPLRDAVAIAKSVIESQLADLEIQAWVRSLIERIPAVEVVRATGTLPETQD